MERLRDESVVERLREAVGKRREDVEVGKEVIDVMTLTIYQHLQISLSMLMHDCRTSTSMIVTRTTGIVIWERARQASKRFPRVLH